MSVARALLVALAAALAWRVLWPPPQAGDAPAAVPAPVPVLAVDAGFDYGQLRARAAPVVLRHTVAAQWPAFRAWDTAALATLFPVRCTPRAVSGARSWLAPGGRLQVLPAHEQVGRPSFITFHDDKPLEPFLPHATWADFNLKVRSSPPRAPSHAPFAPVEEGRGYARPSHICLGGAGRSTPRWPRSCIRGARTAFCTLAPASRSCGRCCPPPTRPSSRWRRFC